MKHLLYILFFINTLLVFSQEEKRLALVIGNADYEKGALKNPVNDAKLIAKTLDSLGFEVLEYYNLKSRRALKNAIREFGVKRDSADVGFVYYAGHGVQIKNENYLLPTHESFDSEVDIEDYAVSVQAILRYLEAKTNQVNILVLDACRDNPFESNWKATRSLKGGGLAKVPPPTGSLIAFSTDAGQTAADGDGENSVYSRSLSKNMLIEGINVDQVFRNVRSEVLKATKGKQRPVEFTQLTGQEFFLNPGNFEDEFKEIEAILNDLKGDKYNALAILEPILNEEPNNIQGILLKARIYTDIKIYKKAYKAFERIIELGKTNLNFYKHRSTYYENLKDYDKALKDYNKWIELEPENANSYYQRGLFYYNYLEEYTKAIVDYTKAIALDGTDIYNYYSRGNAFQLNKQYEQSIADFLRAEELDKDKIFVKSNGLYNNLAVTFGKLKQYEKAIEYYTKEIETRPNNYLGYRNRAFIYSDHLKDYEKAGLDYDKAIALDSLRADNFYYRGSFNHYSLNEYPKAIVDYTKAIALDGTDISNYYFRGNAFQSNKQYEQSIADYLRAEELDKDKIFVKSNGGLYNNLALTFEKLKQYEKAIEYFTKEIEVSPNNYLGYRNRALIYSNHLKDFEKAELDYNKAIVLDSLNALNYKARGEFYHYSLNEYPKAIVDYTKAIALDGTDIYNYQQRGNAFQENKQYEQSIADFLRAEELDKDKIFVKSNGLYNNLAVTFGRLERYEKAIEYCTKEIEIHPNDYLAYRNRAYVYNDYLKDFEKAGLDYDKAIALDSLNALNYKARGYFNHYSLNEYPKAIADYSKAIALDGTDIYNYFYRGNAFRENKQYEHSIADFLRAEELDKDGGFAKKEYLYNSLAITFMELEQYERAIEYYTKEIETSPNNYLGYRNRAGIYSDHLKDYEKAGLDYDKAIALDSLNARNFYYRGSFNHYSLNEYPKAIADYTKAIALDGTDIYCYYYRGISFQENKQHEQSIADFLRVEELDKDKIFVESYSLYNSLAVTFSKLKQYEKALEYYTKEIKSGPNYYNGYYNRAIFHTYHLKDFEKATLDYKKALELAPENNNLNQSFINFNYIQGDFDTVIELARKASERDLKDPQADYVAALVHLEDGKDFKALLNLTKSIDRIKRYAPEGYFISDLNDTALDLSKVFIIRATLYEKFEEKDLMCKDLKDALNFVKDEVLKKEIEKSILEKCKQ